VLAPNALANLAARTTDGESFAFGRRFPLACRPLRTASRMLSSRVPRNRWSEDMQRLMSQEWHTSIPFGIGPFASLYTWRWA